MSAEEIKLAHGQLLAGLVVVVVGLILFTVRISGFGINGWSLLWPVIVIAVGVGQLSDADNRRRGRGSGLAIIVAGVWLLLNSMGLFGFTYGESWPVLLILLGLARLIYPQGRGRGFGLLLVAVGSWFGLEKLDIPGIDFEKLWPILIVLVGLFIVWRAFVPGPDSCCDCEEVSQNVAR